MSSNAPRERGIARILREAGLQPALTILEIGALPLPEGEDPCREALRCLPHSRLFAFEPDRALCERLNAEAPIGVTWCPVALGRHDEKREFFETEHPMCSSLYRPDARWDRAFHNLQVTRLQQTSEVETRAIDSFMRENAIESVDFIKIDVQGAELEVFKGGEAALGRVLFIVCEVEFVPMYHDQPLFGEVDAFLRAHGLGFHKFLGLCGRSMKPVVVNNDFNFPIQHMWSDAVFVRALLEPSTLADDQLLKLAVLNDIYGSPDVSRHFLAAVDSRRGSDLAVRYDATFAQ